MHAALLCWTRPSPRPFAASFATAVVLILAFALLKLQNIKDSCLACSLYSSFCFLLEEVVDVGQITDEVTVELCSCI